MEAPTTPRITVAASTSTNVYADLLFDAGFDKGPAKTESAIRVIIFPHGFNVGDVAHPITFQVHAAVLVNLVDHVQRHVPSVSHSSAEPALWIAHQPTALLPFLFTRGFFLVRERLSARQFVPCILRRGPTCDGRGFAPVAWLDSLAR